MQKLALAISLIAATLTHANGRRITEDATVYVTGDGVPTPTLYAARAQVTWMFARIGFRVGWKDSVPPLDSSVAGPIIIGLRITSRTLKNTHPGALAYAAPFADRIPGITLMYDRVRASVLGIPNMEGTLLAHVLAHEIAHIMQGTNAHSDIGVMKAHWTQQDYADMAKKPLTFTPLDIDLIRQGLISVRGRPAK